MRIKLLLCCLSCVITLACAAQGQAPVQAAQNIFATAPTANVADSAPEPLAALPEAPAPGREIAVTEVPVIRQAVILPEAPTHRFFDKTNLWLHLNVMAAETGDLITTRRILQAGGREANPIARPLMQAGLGGQMAATYGLGEGTALLGSYLLHRTGHHRLERFVPITAMILESLATASNIRTRSNMRVHH